MTQAYGSLLHLAAFLVTQIDQKWRYKANKWKNRRHRMLEAGVALKVNLNRTRLGGVREGMV